MIKKGGFLFLLLCFIYLVMSAYEIPSGGINLISDAIENHSRIGNYGTVSVIDVQHEKFAKAIKIDVTEKAANYWNFQVAFQTENTHDKGDVCLVSFWGRCTKSESEAGEGYLTAVIEHNQTYAKSLSKTFVLGGEWTHFVYGFEANMDLATDKIRAAFFAGYGIQTLEVADIRFLNYKNNLQVADLPKMEVYYSGIEENAPWRTEAAERIEKFRKGVVEVKLVDDQTNLVGNASVSIEMKRHLFGFGTAIDGNTYLNNSTYSNHVEELFNEVVFENDLKWRPWVNRTNHTYITSVINDLQSKNIRIRGHCMIWPGWQYLPGFMEENKGDPERLKQECLDHISEVTAFTKDRLADWDVLNEPYTNTDIQDICGDEVMADWFKKAEEIDPDVKKYINDYSIISNGGVDKNHQDGYFDIIQYIEQKGGKIDGIGLQGHFSEFATGIPKLLEILDRFATLGKEIKITEFDINSENDELKTKYTRDFMTAVFSHPNVKAILCWGFWAGRHWKPESAYYGTDWSIRPNGEVYKNLVSQEWWTGKQIKQTDSNGKADFGSCFLGDYKVAVEHESKSITVEVPILYNSENTITINVDTESYELTGSNIPETPVFSSLWKPATQKSVFRIFPNPANNVLYLEIDKQLTGPFHVVISNLQGVTVSEKVISSDFRKTLNLPDMKPGFYVVSLVSAEDRISQPLIIN